VPGSRVEPLDAALAEAFARETAEINLRRMRILAPLFLALHVAHVAFFWWSLHASATLAADVVRWRELLIVAHAAMIPIMLAVTFIAYRVRNPRVAALVGPLTAFAYVQHGAVVAGIDQIVAANVSVYIGYALGVAVVAAIPPRVTVPIYVAGAITFVVALFTFQRSANARSSHLPTCVTLTAVSVAFAWQGHRTRRRDLVQRVTIDSQRDVLGALNASLAERVQEQVAEIVARAKEVDELNAQLRAQVQARSGELSLALARLSELKSADATLEPGTLLGGRFRIEQRIGSGGMGTVYAGVEQSSGARVAIKVIQAGSADQLDAMRRFIREAGAASTITHRAVVRMLNIDVSDDGLLYQVQELVEGEALSRRVGRPWAAPDAARLVAVLADALAAAHAQGVVHRDVKPDNVMLTAAAPGLKLLDFGIAKLRDAAARAGDSTVVRMIIGTPGYMAPEQERGDRDVTERADVYAAGVILCRLLSGRAVAGDTRAGSLDPSTPAPLIIAIDKCMRESAAQRPTAAQLAADLTKFADDAGAAPLDEIARKLFTQTQASAAAPTETRRVT
jgi:serine/threonine-protein kinase